MTTWLVLVIQMSSGGMAEVRIPFFDMLSCRRAEHDYTAKGGWFSIEHKCEVDARIGREGKEDR